MVIEISKEIGLRVTVGDVTMQDALPFGGMIAIACAILAVTLAFYVLRSLGLYTLAKKNGVKGAFVAWIPFAWIYVVCMLIGDGRFFGWTFKQIALLALVVFSINGIFDILYNALSYVPVIGYFLQGGTITLLEENGGMKLFLGEDFLNPYSNYNAVKAFLNVTYYVNGVLSLVVTVVTVFAFIALFRKFWPQHYILASVLSVMGLFPPFVFAIRNRQPVKYADYLRSRFYYADSYGQNPPQGTPRPPESPFGEFAERGDKDPGDPFAEFSDNDNKEDK